MNKCSGVTATFKDDSRGIECRSGNDCISNTTLCVYNNGGHFNRPSFSEAFPMFDEVGNFFAKDACLQNNGRWSNKLCLCDNNSKAKKTDLIFCSQTTFDTMDVNGKLISTRAGAIVSFLLVGLGLVTHNYINKYKKIKKDRWEKLSTNDSFEVELPQVLESQQRSCAHRVVS